jgi:glucose/mannose transport system permease protein
MTWRERRGRIAPLLMIWPPILVSCSYVLGFSAWTVWVSFTRATLLPDYTWAGWRNYTLMLANRN